MAFAALLLLAGCAGPVHDETADGLQPPDNDALGAKNPEPNGDAQKMSAGDSEAFREFRNDLWTAVDTGDTTGLAERVNVRSAGGETALIWCATENQIECVKLLLSLGADTELEYIGQTALMCASSLGYVEMTRLLLDNGASVGHQSQRDGQSAIHYAAIYEKSEMVSLLRSYGAPLETLNSYDQSPLMDCASSDMKAAVDQLLELGADPFFRNSQGQTALHFAAMFGSKSAYDRLSQIPGLAEIEDNAGLVASYFMEVGE